MKRQVVIHPVLFAVYPTLFLFAQNFSYVDPQLALRPLAVTLLLVVALWGLLGQIMGGRDRAAPALSVGVMAFFSVRPISEAVDKLTAGGGEELSLTTSFALTCLAVALAGVAWMLVKKANVEPVNYLMNVVGLVLIAFPAVHTFQLAISSAALATVAKPLPAIEAPAESGQTPDIYFIVLDGYARGDVLRDLYGHDNSEFLGTLRELGFVVADESTSNYSTTALSIASTLNMAYVDEALGEAFKTSSDWRFARKLFRNSRLAQFLEGRGYETVALASQYYNVDYRTADVYLDRWWFQTEFETLLLRTTPLPWLSRQLGAPFLYESHRQQNLFVLDQVTQLPDTGAPKFVFAHVLCPHPPFVFGPGGTAVNPPRPYDWAEGYGFLSKPGATMEEYKAGYRGQVEFLNGVVPGVLREILNRSATPPIIVLQSDHGPASGLSVVRLGDPAIRERFGVLNAMYLPGLTASQPPSDSSLVNTFRYVLGSYFGADLPSLPKKHFFLEDGRPYDYLPVTAPLGPLTALEPPAGPGAEQATP